MREIKFRGLNMKREWVFGSLVLTTFGNTKTWIVKTARGSGGWFNVMGREYVRPKTVGQFTGLTDKNGKKIFEGDIVKFENAFSRSPFVGQVRYYAGCKPVLDNDNRAVDIAETNNDDDLEVIGNIHESPELLEASK